jgi:hypothetical protein
MSMVSEISKKAKKIRRPGETWQSAIKRASKMVKVGSVKKAKPKKSYQTGTSKKIVDERKRAKPPGKRIVKTASGKHAYYERRKNRSDMPGSLTGVAAQSSAYRTMILRRLSSNSVQLAQADRDLSLLQSRYKSAEKGAQKSFAKKRVEVQKRFIQSLKTDMTNLKRLL